MKVTVCEIEVTGCELFVFRVSKAVQMLNQLDFFEVEILPYARFINQTSRAKKLPWNLWRKFNRCNYHSVSVSLLSTTGGRTSLAGWIAHEAFRNSLASKGDTSNCVRPLNLSRLASRSMVVESMKFQLRVLKEINAKDDLIWSLACQGVMIETEDLPTSLRLWLRYST